MPFLSPSALAIACPSAMPESSVVLVDMQIAVRLERNVDQRVARQLLDHMVEKANTRRDLVRPGPVEIDGGRDRGLLGLAGDSRCPRLALCAPLLHVSQSSANPLAIRFRTRLYAPPIGGATAHALKVF